MPRPSAAALIERLRDVYEEETGVRLSDEKLAARLPISLSTFNRWKRKDTASFDAIVEMLETAGWISTVEASDVPSRESSLDRLAKLAVGVAALEKGQAKVIRLLEEAKAARQSPPSADPKPKTRTGR